MRFRPTDIDTLAASFSTLLLAASLGALTPSAASAQTCPGATFAAPVAYTAPAACKSIAIGDFNGDGKLDLVTCYGSTTTSNVGIMLNAGAGVFGAIMATSVAGTPSAVAVGDFNGDNKLDVALAYSGTGLTSTVSILRGDGDGTLQAAVNYTVFGTTRNIAVGDFNGDGKPDLAVATGTTSGVSVLLNNGDGTFASPVAYGGSTNVLWVVVGDFNHDNRPDLALAISGGTVAVLLGNGDGTFQAPLNVSVSLDVSLAVGDLNGDGNPDLVVGTSGGGSQVTVLLGNGSGGFSSPITYAGAASPQAVAIADFNGDGKPDIVATSIVANVANSYVYQNNGDGTFQPGVAVPTLLNNFRIAAADLNGDGLPDFVVTSSNQVSATVVINTTSPCMVACCRASSCVQVPITACTSPGVVSGIGVACNAPDNNTMPCCRANFNQVGGVTVSDIFAFLSAWFAHDPSADFNGDSQILVNDIFNFLSAWFAGCP